MIEFVRTFGEVDGNRLLLDHAVIRRTIQHLDRLRSGLVHLMDKGGIAAVFGDEGTLVTTHACEDHRGKRRRRRSRRGASWQAA
jgi:hypothetical protein